MTNQTIILNESFKLMQQGILKGSGKFTEIIDQNGKRQVEIPEEIHTFQKWKELGYTVKKGQKSIAKFPIWKYTVKKFEYTDKFGEEQESEKSNMFMKVSAFFKAEQVEPLKA